MVGKEGFRGIVCYSRMFYGDWMNGGKGREWGNCVLTAECFMVIVWIVGREGSGGIVCWQQNVLWWLYEWWEGKGLGELCVDSRMCEGDWMNGGKGREWRNCVLTAECFMVIGWMVGREGSGGIVCWQQNVLGWLDEWWEGKGMGELCVDSRLFYGDCMNGGKGRDWGNCVLTADCFMVIVWMVGREGSGGIVCWQQNVLWWLDEWWEGKGMGELCVDSRIFYGDWMNGRKGREWGNCVLTAECVRGIGWMVGR